MASAIEQKKDVVEEIKSLIQQSHSFVVVDYKGLTVAEDTQMRNKYREAGCVYKVLKNRLVKIALNDLGYTQYDHLLEGPTAIAFGMSDAVAPAKIAMAIMNDTKKTAVKCGMVDGAFLDVEGVKALATLPPREVLVAKLLGMLQSPITGFVRVLNGPVSGLARVLNAISEKKGA
jgi:large subunit ribosomal protein L10